MPFTDLKDWIPALLGGLSAFADAILGVGIVVPGEVAVTGLAVTLDDAQTAPFVVMVALGASLGDHLNYGLGRVGGPRLARSRAVAALACGTGTGRAAPRPIRAVGHRAHPSRPAGAHPHPGDRRCASIPAIAGASGLSYSRFLPASMLGSMLWALTWVLAANVITLALSEAGFVATALGTALAALAGLLRMRRSRRRRS